MDIYNQGSDSRQYAEKNIENSTFDRLNIREEFNMHLLDQDFNIRVQMQIIQNNNL